MSYSTKPLLVVTVGILLFVNSVILSDSDFDVAFTSPSPSNFIKLTIDKQFVDLSVCLWLKNKDVSSSTVQGLVTYKNSLGQSFMTMLNTTASISIFQYKDASGMELPSIVTKAHVGDGAWHDVCFVWDHAVGSLKTFTAGKQDNFHIFMAWAEGSFKGDISRLNIWDRPLTLLEVRRMFLECSTKAAPPAHVVTWERATITFGIQNYVDVVDTSVTCDRQSLRGFFAQLRGGRCPGHVIRQVEAPDIMTCAHHCLSNPNCKSFNAVRRFPGRLMCELLEDGVKGEACTAEFTQESDHYYKPDFM
ncbi:predicted protein [Nematostella vectensis]|uniref:Apple domain-containing protein n=1 Tax=Nematostella vectensis TaxID=45351 RepID=A7S366_NEMVE|nr:predicted protein [Nematostella vectensis]|eukprot:XP_001633860.1 predicted protein [Nematostella vectensis]